MTKRTMYSKWIILFKHSSKMKYFNHMPKESIIFRKWRKLNYRSHLLTVLYDPSLVCIGSSLEFSTHHGRTHVVTDGIQALRNRREHVIDDNLQRRSEIGDMIQSVVAVASYVISQPLITKCLDLMLYMA